jgi:hypothetical protein
VKAVGSGSEALVRGLRPYAERIAHLRPGSTVQLSGCHDLDSSQTVGRLREPHRSDRSVEMVLSCGEGRDRFGR